MRVLVILTLLLSPFFLCAQTWTPKGDYKYRSGDKISVYLCFNAAIGDKGENVVWDFSRISSDEQSQAIELSSDYENEAAIAKVVGNTRYYYIQDSCAIRCTGFENNTMRVEYDRPTVAVPFPIAYGNKQEGVFHGIGMYSETLMMRLFGTYSANVDATGTLLLPDGEKLDNVRRIHIVNKTCAMPYTWINTRKGLLKHVNETVPFNSDSISAHINNGTDSVSEEETYLWYADGYRYPIVETYIYVNDRKRSRTVYCPPCEQRKMYDSDNEAIRANVRKESDSEDDNANENSDGQYGDSIEFPYRIKQIGNVVTICFNEKPSVQTACLLSSSSGIVYRRTVVSDSETVALDCCGLIPGDYIIKVSIGEKEFSSVFHYK